MKKKSTLVNYTQNLLFLYLCHNWTSNIFQNTFEMRSSFSFNAAEESPDAACKLMFLIDLNSFSSLASSFCRCLTSAFSDITTLTWALVLTCLAQLAKRSVFLDCSTWLRAGLMVQIIAVLALPPKEFCSMRVSLEFLYGTCPFLPLLHQIWHGSYIPQDFP